MDNALIFTKWLIGNSDLVYWIVAIIAGLAYRLYHQRHNDNNVSADLKFIADSAKTASHVVNNNPNIPATEAKEAIISMVRRAVDSYNENHKTHYINVTNTQISHATDVAIDIFKKDFGSFNDAKQTLVKADDIEKALAKDTTPTSVATINNTTPVFASSSASSASSASATPAGITHDEIVSAIKEALKGDAK